MRLLRRCVVLTFGIALLVSCDAERQPTAAVQQEVDKTVRHYIELRNDGNLNELLRLSCEDLYSSTQKLIHQSKGERAAVVDSMREHPLSVESVTVNRAGDFKIDATMVGSPKKGKTSQHTGKQRVELRQYKDGYRVCQMNA